MAELRRGRCENSQVFSATALPLPSRKRQKIYFSSRFDCLNAIDLRPLLESEPLSFHPRPDTVNFLRMGRGKFHVSEMSPSYVSSSARSMKLHGPIPLGINETVQLVQQFPK